MNKYYDLIPDELLPVLLVEAWVNSEMALIVICPRYFLNKKLKPFLERI